MKYSKSMYQLAIAPLSVLFILFGPSAFAAEICGPFAVAGLCTQKDTLNDQIRCAFTIGGKDIERIFMTIDAYNQLSVIVSSHPSPNVCANIANEKIVAFSLNTAESRQEIKPCFEALNSHECANIPDCHWVSSGLGVGCWPNN
jgi:hypothetical protein